MTACTVHIATKGPERGLVFVFPPDATGRRKAVSGAAIRRHLGISIDALSDRKQRSLDPALILAPGGQNARAFRLAEDWRAVLDELPEYAMPTSTPMAAVAGWGWA